MSSRGQRFRRRALRRGYKVDEVDAFLERVEATLAGTPIGRPVTAQEVHDVVFRVRFGGYDEWQVDLHLDRVERQLAEAAAAGGFDQDRTGTMDRIPPAPMSPPAPRQAPSPEGGYPPYDDSPAYGEGYPPGESGRHGRFDMTTEMHFDEPLGPPMGREHHSPATGAQPVMSDATAEHVMPDLPDPGTGEHTPARGPIGRGPAHVGRPPMGPPPMGPPTGMPPGGVPPTGPGGPAGGVGRPVPPDGMPPASPAGMPPHPVSPGVGYGPTGGPSSVPPTAGLSPTASADVQRVDQLRRTFQPRRFGSGYDRGQVDQLFEAVLRGLSGHGPLSISEADLDPKRFDLVPGGYFEAEVENALNEVREILRRH